MKMKNKVNIDINAIKKKEINICKDNEKKNINSLNKVQRKVTDLSVVKRANFTSIT